MPKAINVPICSEFQGAWKCDVCPSGGCIPGVVSGSIVLIVADTVLTHQSGHYPFMNPVIPTSRLGKFAMLRARLLSKHSGAVASTIGESSLVGRTEENRGSRPVPATTADISIGPPL